MRVDSGDQQVAIIRPLLVDLVIDDDLVLASCSFTILPNSLGLLGLTPATGEPLAHLGNPLAAHTDVTTALAGLLRLLRQRDSPPSARWPESPSSSARSQCCRRQW
jgi:hypothetical protein